ncbi:MAG: phosphatase PAP2 family protein [Candidatus Hodarchaeales archaeon]
MKRLGYVFIKDLYHITIINRLGVFFLFLFLLTPFIYTLLDFIVDIDAYGESLQNSKNYLTFDVFLTSWLQSLLGEHPEKHILGILMAYFYTFGFLSISAFAYVVLLILIIRDKDYRNRDPFIYIAIAIIMFFVDVGGYWFYPTAPPVRIDPDQFHFRILVLPMGDDLIQIKYNALPSGHIWALSVPYLAAKSENLRFWKWLYGSAIVITTWVVCFTGDHYFIDATISFLLCTILVTLFAIIYDYRNNRSKLASQEVIFKRMGFNLIAFIVLIFMSIITLNDFHNEFLFVIQLICVFVIWPLIVFKINMKGLLAEENLVHRSSIQDFKDFFNRIRDNYSDFEQKDQKRSLELKSEVALDLTND